VNQIHFLLVFAAFSAVDGYYTTPTRLVEPAWPTSHHQTWWTFKVEPQSSIITSHDDHQQLSPHELVYRRH